MWTRESTVNKNDNSAISNLLKYGEMKDFVLELKEIRSRIYHLETCFVSSIFTKDTEPDQSGQEEEDKPINF